MSSVRDEPVLPGIDFEPEPLFVLSELDQVRAVATPLRIAILDCLATKARTVREVGDVLGINSTKLYYHVSELERTGLALLVHTEVQSGIQQKFYRARARYYHIASHLLNSSEDESGATTSFMVALLEDAARELRRSVTKGVIDADKWNFKFSRRQIRLTREQATELRARLHELDEWALSLDDPDGEFEFEFNVAMFPRDLSDDD
jgi:DNA-binding transcriptional ArsR family regulator